MGKKLTIFLIDGDEAGPKIVEIGNWVGKGVYVPRIFLPELLKKRSEFQNPGIYFLRSVSSYGTDSHTERIYIGEAENICNRLKHHINDPGKEFNEVIFFISKDELLTKSQIRYLEAKFIELVQSSSSVQIENYKIPAIPILHEADVSDMEYFIKQVKLILPLLGLNFLNSGITDVKHFKPKTEEVRRSKLFYIKSPGIDA